MLGIAHGENARLDAVAVDGARHAREVGIHGVRSGLDIRGTLEAPAEACGYYAQLLLRRVWIGCGAQCQAGHVTAV